VENKDLLKNILNPMRLHLNKKPGLLIHHSPSKKLE
jgi:hypothetical protein